MPEAISIACPHCSVKLKVKDASKFGKTVPCPQCRKPFVVQPPPVEDDLEVIEDEAEAIAAEPEIVDYALAVEPEEDAPPPPVAKRRPVEPSPGSARTKPKKRATSAAASPWFSVSQEQGGVAVLVLVMVGLYAAGVIFKKKEQGRPVATAPAQGNSPANTRPGGNLPEGRPAANASQPNAAANPPAAGANPPAGGLPGSSAATPPATIAGSANPTGVPAGAAAPARGSLDIALLPPTAEFVVIVRVADLWNAPLVQSFVNTPPVQQGVTLMHQATGFAPADIESAALAVNRLPQDTAASPALWAVGAMQGAAGLRSLFVSETLVTLRTRKPVDATTMKIGEHGFVPAQHQGKAYFVRPPELGAAPGDAPFALYIAAPALLVLGPQPLVMAAIERADKPAVRPELAFVNPDAHVLLMAVPQDRAKFAGSPPSEAAAGETASPLQQALATHGKAYCFGVKVAGGLSFESAIDCQDAAGAEQIRQGLAGSVQEGRESFDEIRSVLPPDIVQLADLLLASIQTAGQGGTVRATAAIPDSAQELLARLPAQIMPLLATFSARQLAGQIEKNSRDVTAADEVLFREEADEGDAQSPVTFDGIPEEVTMVGRVRWEREQEVDGDRERSSRRLEILLDLEGGPAAETALYGMYKVGKIATDNGARLTLSVPPSGKHPARAFVRRDPDDLMAAHPPEGVRAVFAFQPPRGSIEMVTAFEGSLTLRIPREAPTTVTIEKFQSRVGKPVDHPDLKKAGFQLRLSKEELLLALKVLKGNVDRIGEVYPVDADGTRLEGYRFIPSPGTKDDKPQFQMTATDDLPEDAGLAITLYEGLDDVTIPFRFADMPVLPRKDEADGDSSP